MSKTFITPLAQQAAQHFDLVVVGMHANKEHALTKEALHTGEEFTAAIVANVKQNEIGGPSQ